MGLFSWIEQLFHFGTINKSINGVKMSTTQITFPQLTLIFPTTSNLLNFIGPLNDTFIKYQINSPKRICAFLAQVGEESEYFKLIEENLNYSVPGLLSIFPSHFDSTTAQEYAHNPEKIANRVYANRMGNGDESSGDGWKFRGRSLLQCTGKDNYTEYSNSLGKSIDEVINFMENYTGATDFAGYYWNKHNLNQLADSNNIIEITKKTNGGLNGLTVRESIYNTAIKIVT
jgi:putative chitinase